MKLYVMIFKKSSR